MIRSLGLITLLFLAGCELYQSRFPITDKPISAIQKELLGTWAMCDEIDGAIAPFIEIEILEEGNQVYLLLLKLNIDKADDVQVFPFKIWKSTDGEFRNYLNVLHLNALPDTVINIIRYHKSFYSNEQLFVQGLTNDFRFSFQNQMEFRNLFYNNRGSFEKYLSKSSFQFVRWYNLTWERVNSGWIRRIVLIENAGKIVEKEPLLEYFKNYHLIKNEGIWNETPHKFVAWLGVNDSVVIFQNNQYLFDVTNDKWYAKNQNN